MGYYSNLLLERMEIDYDRSFPTPEMQFLWRLDDLHDRLEVLGETGASYNGDGRLDDSDIRYALPNYFQNISDVERAIELAMNELHFEKVIFYNSPKIKALTFFQKEERANCSTYKGKYEHVEV